MLEFTNVTRRFGDKVAVDRISLTIPAGQMVGIIGASGAGKSTLLRMINRLIDVSDGQIRFEGAEVSGLRGKRLRDWQRDCAMIFQQFNLVPRLNVLTNVMLGRLNRRSSVHSLLGIFSEDEQLLALKALERLGIARALLQEPKVILADEPIASLDPRNAQVLMDALKSINENDGITVVTNLHTLDTARNYCERIIGMAAGKIVFDGTPDELTTDVARSIYGADGLEEAFSEGMTSTALAPSQPRRKKRGFSLAETAKPLNAPAGISLPN